MSASLESIVDSARHMIEAAGSLAELRDAETQVLGKGSDLAAEQRGLGALDPDDRKARGEAVNLARAAISKAALARRATLESSERVARLEAERLDLTEARPQRPPGWLHLVTQTRDTLEDVFVGMGYEVVDGPEVESDFNNFEALNMPPAHPARTSFDTLYLDLGEPETLLLRTHTSPVQVRLMQSQSPPIYAVMPGRVYRKDTPDARHTPTFNQIEGLVVDHGITFGDLAGTIETFTAAYFGPAIHARLRPAYFPFTEPSAEFEITCTICEGSGCRTCSGTGWIELGGCGMVHPNVFAACGLDAEEWTGFAFGFGIDRLAQMRHGISDMRVLFDNDLRFASQF
ncbi:MAG TPA: phenylalanine--tRNA ligase subunit alpha [Acidimicrobiales bacterium]|nr:phenylalanine--tRNA ligase subunit alpha [Acidimicrobiales bacterium]